MSTKRKKDSKLLLSAKRRVVFGQHIRMLREKRGLSQEELAERIGLTRVSIVNLESGRQTPPLTSIPEYATALETSITIVCHGIRE